MERAQSVATSSAVLQRAFIFAKAKQSPQTAVENLADLQRYLESRLANHQTNAQSYRRILVTEGGQAAAGLSWRFDDLNSVVKPYITPYYTDNSHQYMVRLR